MPEAGGLMDQPATWVDAATYLAGAIAEIREEDRRRELEKAKQKPKPARR